MIVDLLEGIFSELTNSTSDAAIAVREYLNYFGSGDLTVNQAPPYMTWDVPTSSPTQYVMQPPGALLKYKTVEVTFAIVTREKRKINVGKCAKQLQNLFERSNFDLPNGRVIDAVVVDDFAVQNTDSNGYTWFVGFHFMIGT